MTYDEWILVVIALGEAKGLKVYYYEEPPRWGSRIGHFEGYCGNELKVWAGAGEDLLGPAVYTSPEEFTRYWPTCIQSSDQPPGPRAPTTELGLWEYRVKGARWVDPNVAGVVYRAMKVIFQ